MKEAWVRVLAIPLHLWRREAFKKIRDCCRGFIEVDEVTASLNQLQWARTLVKLDGKALPSTLHLAVGSSCFSFHLWWEILPRFS